MLDSDLAVLYGVETGALNRAVKRHKKRFPEDFMFQLTEDEWENLICQFGISSCEGEQGISDLRLQIATANFEEEAADDNLRLQIATSSSWGGRRHPPYVFTEHGVVMLASVLNTEIAVHASIQVVKAFVRLRQMIASNRELAKRLDELEKKYDSQFRQVFEAIRKLMIPTTSEQRRIGFRKGRG